KLHSIRLFRFAATVFFIIKKLVLFVIDDQAVFAGQPAHSGIFDPESRNAFLKDILAKRELRIFNPRQREQSSGNVVMVGDVVERFAVKRFVQRLSINEEWNMKSLVIVEIYVFQVNRPVICNEEEKGVVKPLGFFALLHKIMDTFIEVMNGI